MYKHTILISLVTLYMLSCSANPNRFKTIKDANPKNKSSLSNLAELKLVDKIDAPQHLEQKNNIHSYKFGNLTLIHKYTPNNPVVSARLYINDGTQNLTQETEGINAFAMQIAVNGGTKTHDKDAFNAILDSVGASVYAFNDFDYSGYGMRSLAENFDRVWPLFTDAVMSPVFPDDEIELYRTQQLAAIASRSESADTQVVDAAKKLLFAKHPYQFQIEGTLESVKKFTKPQLIETQRIALNKNALLLVVVGNINKIQLLKSVTSSFGKIESATPVKNEKPNFQYDASHRFTNIERDLPTHYVFGMFEAPSPAEKDYVPMLIAMSYLHDQLFEEVRTKRNLSYAVSAGMSSKEKNYGFLYVTAVDLPTTMKVIFDQVAELKVLEIPSNDLEETRNVFITSYYRGLETNADQASFLAKWHLKTGSWLNSQNILERIKAVTPSDIQRVAAKYLGNYRFAVVGKGNTDPALFPANK